MIFNIILEGDIVYLTALNPSTAEFTRWPLDSISMVRLINQSSAALLSIVTNDQIVEVEPHEDANAGEVRLECLRMAIAHCDGRPMPEVESAAAGFFRVYEHGFSIRKPLDLAAKNSPENDK